jgi:hypothetical protein
MLARVIGENIELDLQLGVVPPVIADVGQIEQVVMNLAVNARDAMPFGGCLTIRTARAAMDTSDRALAASTPASMRPSWYGPDFRRLEPDRRLAPVC